MGGEHGIAKGMTDTTFAPNMAVTREQMVTLPIPVCQVLRQGRNRQL